MGSNSIYEKIGFGTIGLCPRQKDHYTREIESDDGTETALQITRTEMEFSFVLAHYNQDEQELMRSSPWMLDAKLHGLSVAFKKEGDNHWSITGKEGVVLHIMVANDGDISLHVVNPHKGENVFHVPEFCLVTSGTKAHALLMTAGELVQQIRADDKNKVSNELRPYYVLLERFYEAIGEHHKFKPLSQ